MMINCKLKYELKVVNLIHHLKLYIPCSPSMMEQPETHRKPAGQKDQISGISRSKMSLKSLHIFFRSILTRVASCQQMWTTSHNFAPLNLRHLRLCTNRKHSAMSLPFTKLPTRKMANAWF